MPVSPRDFELYSRMTGTPMPSDAMSRMQMAPEVFEFTKNFARQPNLLEKTGNLIKNIGKIGAYGLGMGMQQSLKAEKRLLKEELRNEQAKRDAEIAEVPESPEQVSAGSGVVQTDLNPIGGSNVRRKVILTDPPQYENEVIDSPFSQQPTTADAYGQDDVPNQTASNIINQKVVQGSQIGDETPNVAQVLSESQDSRPSGFADPAQVESQMRFGMEGSELGKDQLAKFLSQKGLDQALLGAVGERISAEPRIGDSSPLLDHPDIVGGEDDINLPGGMNTDSTTNLEDHYREMRRMDAMERNKEAINEIVEKTPTPSEMQVGRSPNLLAGKDQAAFEALTGDPSQQRRIEADQARSRVEQKTAAKQRMAGMSTPLVEQYYPSDVARTDFQIGGMTARKTGLPKSVGISYTPMNGETGVTYNIMNDPTKPLDVSRTHFTATPEAVQQLLSQTGELGEASYGQQYNKGKRRMAGLGSMDESRIDDDNFLII
tara:strand:- start:5213 stop:6679 length:1467 start_codon:yes stop_codon:yes gene_type:complete